MFERSSNSLLSRLCICLLSAALLTSLSPIAAHADEEKDDPARTDEESPLATQDDAATTAAKTIGSCVWEIKDGVLTISPADGQEGHLPNYPDQNKWPWADETYTSVTLTGKVVAGESLSSFFYNAKYLTVINDLDKLDTSHVIDMSRMFEGCINLTSVNVSNFDTSSVKKMARMFYNCSSLTSLDVSQFKTTLVEDMNTMFADCSKLTSLSVNHFETRNVKDMSHMFEGCIGLTSLDISKFDTSSVTNMQCMFYRCTSLTSLYLRNFITQKVTNMAWMFADCFELKTLDVSSFETGNVTDMREMFANCKALKELDLHGFDMSKVEAENCTSMFLQDNNLSKIIIGEKFSAQDKLPVKVWYNEKGTMYSGRIPNTAGTYTTTKPGTSSSNTNTGNSSNTTTQNTKKITMYRLYNPYSGEHLFTKDLNEYNTLGKIGWKKEGTAWYAPETGKPVYRLYNPYSGDHHYTTDANEYIKLGRIGWKREGVAWYSGGNKPVYRLFNPYVKIGTHHYTTDQNEYNSLGRIGWKKENVGWYGM